MTEKIQNYGKFLYFYYFYEKNQYHICNDSEKLKNYDTNKCILYFGIEDNTIDHFQSLKYNVSYNDFPWKSYLHLNHDLTQFKTKTLAWNHWITHGIKEERTYTYINNSSLHQGRFGNLFFVNMFLHFISFKYNLKCYYKYEKLFNELGIYFNKGNQKYQENCLVTDKNFLHILRSKILKPCNVILHNVWFQEKEFCSMLQSYFKNDKIKNKIIEKNIFKTRYQNNNDLFIHIRLGDVTNITNTNTTCYDVLISRISYRNGFIASDSLNHPLCKELIQKYNFQIIDFNEIKTIMFASTCKHIVLSGGTFSWLIGFLAFYTENVYYKDFKKRWYGDIFSFSDWKKI
jgi:hypothetical protein